jgi:hypothetical protein
MPYLPEVKEGNWYFVVICPDCGRQQAIGPAPSPQQTLWVRPFPDTIPCDCGALTPYQPDEIQRLQATSSAASGPNGAFRPDREK